MKTLKTIYIILLLTITLSFTDNKSKLTKEMINNITIDIEQPLEIEDWMINDKLFYQPCLTIIEEPLEIEDWMINDKLFGF